MKYLVLLCDGMADKPVDALGGKTPMMTAKKPNMDALAAKSQFGMCQTVPNGMSPGSDVANLSVMGYNPAIGYSGRSPLEAASLGINLTETDVTFRLNFVTLSDDEDYLQKRMIDYSAGDIETHESAELIKFLQESLGDDEFSFTSGFMYRHILLQKNGDATLTCAPPHDISNQIIAKHVENRGFMLEMMKKSYDLLSNHPINLARIEKGLLPANSVWFWGSGTKPNLQNFKDKFGKNGAVITAVDLLKGIAKLAGMLSPTVQGATGYIDTNFQGKVDAALNCFENGCDYVYLHVEAPDECGHRFELENKILAIELIDKKVLKPMLTGLEKYDDYKILIMPDHPTFVETGAHSSDPVPWILYQKSVNHHGLKSFTEENCKHGEIINAGHEIMDKLLS